MSIEELNASLRVVAELGTDRGASWDDHAPAFRQAVLLAIRDTSQALLSPTIPRRWRDVLDVQLQGLFRLLALTDDHIATCAGALPPVRH